MSELDIQVLRQTAESAVGNIIKKLNPLADSAAKEVIETVDTAYKNYEYYKYAMTIMCIILIAMVVLSCVFSATTGYTAYQTNEQNHNMTTELIRALAESERRDRPLYDYTYRSAYTHSIMQEIEQSIYDMQEETDKAGLSTAIMDIRIKPSDIYQNVDIRSYALNPAKIPSPIFQNLVKDSWLSASEPGISYLLQKSNSNTIYIDVFVDHKEYNTLLEFLSTDGSDQLKITQTVGSDINLVFEFKVYQKDRRNKTYFLMNPDDNDHHLPDSIPSSIILPYHKVDIIGRDQINVLQFMKKYDENNNNTKPYLFYYWDNPKGKKTPTYIKLCHETIKKHCKKSFNVVKLSESNIYDYIPDLLPYKKKVNNLELANRVDIYRVFLLYRYGGMYIDSDTVVMKNPSKLLSPLSEPLIEYVGFGCTGSICRKDGYMRPSNGLMCARKGAFLFRDIRQHMINLMDHNELQSVDFDNNTPNYFMVGKHLIWYVLDRYGDDETYKYFHVSSDLIGTRDHRGRWVTNRTLFGTDPIKYADESSLIFIVFYNSGINDSYDATKMNRDELLSSDMEIGRFFRKSLRKTT
jgi:Capsular polysaccharide synthesis protein